MKKTIFLALTLLFGSCVMAQETAKSPTYEKSQKSMVKFLEKIKNAGFEMTAEEYPKVLEAYTEAYEVMVKCKAENPEDKAAADACAKPAVTERTKKLTSILGAERTKQILALHKVAHAQK